MSQATELMEHYRDVRQRLRTPANAVADIGIDLNRSAKVIPLFNPRPKPEPRPVAAAPEISAPPITESPPEAPFQRPIFTFSSILKLVAADFNISGRDIRSHCRFKNIVLPRQVAIWMTCKHGRQTLTGMARYLKMDHTSMIHGRKRVDWLMTVDSCFRQRIALLEDKLFAAFPRTPVPTEH